jgi:precorrin-6Y C5,15-methyltransferase (decarboxylating) CbiT subunit
MRISDLKSHIPHPTSHIPFGIPDSEFSHTKGMITKEEIRVIAISKLKLKNNSIVWDVGAGCGSISIEAALLAGKGKVFAVEKEKSRVIHIEKNKKRFAISNLEIIHRNAPDCLKKLPMPDAVFIGGGGEDIGKILAVCSKKLTARGIIVVNAITLDTLKAATDFFKKSNWNSETVSVNIAKTKDIAKLQLFNAYNPIFITIGEKP